jgi:hypothetical protein
MPSLRRWTSHTGFTPTSKLTTSLGSSPTVNKRQFTEIISLIYNVFPAVAL